MCPLGKTAVVLIVAAMSEGIKRKPALLGPCHRKDGTSSTEVTTPS